MRDAEKQPSEYLQYLPTIFREAAVDGTATGEFLPKLLKVFQKILTGVKNNDGIEDDIKIEDRSGERIYEPLESVIDELDQFFDPFRTDPRFLDWLASWVALEPEPEWTRAERRKMIARMVQVSRRIGMKAGLYDYLDVYARESLRPRVSIDDDEAVFRVVLRGDAPAQVGVLAFAQIFQSGNKSTPILYRPTAIAVLETADKKPENVRYVVADAGEVWGSYPPDLAPCLWVLRPNGELDDAHWVTSEPRTGPPSPRPLNREAASVQGQETDLLSAPVAVVPEGPGSLLVLDQGHKYGRGNVNALPCIFRYSRSPAGFAREQVKSLGQNLDDRHPIGMVLVSDDANKEKQLVVLDHAKKKTPRLLIIGPVSGKTAAGQPAEVKLAEIELKDKAGKPIVVTPTAIVQDGESAGIFVIADACDDETEAPPGALVRVKIEKSGDGTQWSVRKLESWRLEHEGNVLVYPTCLAREGDGVYLVCDAGFKLSEFEYADIRTKAEPAGLYRVYLGRDGGTRVARLAYRGGLMNPSSMAFDSRNGALLIADRGEIRGGETHVLWRGVAHRLGVSVLFSKERLPKPLLHASDPKKPDPEQGLAWEQLDTASRGIDLVIGQNKPHHALRVWKTHL